MRWLIMGLILGAVFYGAGRFLPDLEAWMRKSLKWTGLIVATLGVMIWVSAIYVNYTPWFYVPALALGAVGAALGFFYQDLRDDIRDKSRWIGSTLLIAGLVMALVPPGLSLFVAMVALAAVIYLKLVKTGKAQQIISDVDRKLEEY